jgi:hypothetical protein
MSEQRNSSLLLTAPTRRQMIARVAMAFGGLSVGSATSWANADELDHRELWSGRWESNPRPKLGKLLYCHCTTPAHFSSLLIIHN